MALPALTDVAYAEANHGRWIARCPYHWCTNAMQLERGQQAFLCAGLGGCGTTAGISWPADPAAIEALLVMRPAAATRNWLPGEALTDLLAENAAHNVLPPDWTAPLEVGETRLLLDTTDDRAVCGLLFEQLVAANPQREIGA